MTFSRCSTSSQRFCSRLAVELHLPVQHMDARQYMDGDGKAAGYLHDDRPPFAVSMKITYNIARDNRNVNHYFCFLKSAALRRDSISAEEFLGRLQPSSPASRFSRVVPSHKQRPSVDSHGRHAIAAPCLPPASSTCRGWRTGHRPARAPSTPQAAQNFIRHLSRVDAHGMLTFAPHL